MEKKVTISQIALKYGLYLGLVFIIISIITQFMDLDMKTQQNVGYINYVLALVAIILAHKAFKEEGDGFMTIGQGLGIGTLLCLISGVLSAIFTYVYIKFIDDSMIGKIKDMQIEELEKRGMSDADIEQAMKMAGIFTSPEMMIVWIILGMVFIGFILSLIVSLFTKKVNPNFQL
ncbi:MAG: DUF4199 domain-containing protein [Cyclobacteriaceae bacterium]|nr:DUF4199 domain-containing protein [Cyclobacteriaceae bacterium]